MCKLAVQPLLRQDSNYFRLTCNVTFKVVNAQTVVSSTLNASRSRGLARINRQRITVFRTSCTIRSCSYRIITASTRQQNNPAKCHVTKKYTPQRPYRIRRGLQVYSGVVYCSTDCTSWLLYTREGRSRQKRACVLFIHRRRTRKNTLRRQKLRKNQS